MSVCWWESHFATSFSRTTRRICSARRRRSSEGMESAWWIASACARTSNGLTESANEPISSWAPAFSERITTPSRSLTSGASLATRFMPSKTAFTSSTS
jgi:hypothetical protein